MVDGQELGVTEDTDPGLMLLAFKLDAHGQWEFTRQEFINGWSSCGYIFYLFFVLFFVTCCRAVNQLLVVQSTPSWFIMMIIILYRCFTIEEMKKKLAEWRGEIKTDRKAFRAFYFFVFDYLKEQNKVILSTSSWPS